MNTRISLLAEIPEELHEPLNQFIETHPAWDQDRVFSAALSLFLLQNGRQDRRTSQIYVSTVFGHAVSER